MGKQITTKTSAATGSDSITVTDNRTGKTIEILITNNSVPATAFKVLKVADPASADERDDPDNGLRLVDPAFLNTASISSKITFIDGTRGILRYRGYPIEQLAEKSSFLEVSYLLIYGELPNKKNLNRFETQVSHHSFVHSDLEKLVQSFRYDSHPMSILTASFASLSALHSEANPSLVGQGVYSNGTPNALIMMDKQILRLIGKAPTLASMAYRIRQGRPFNRPPEGAGYTESFLYMSDHLTQRDYKPNPVFCKALETLFILHADHELNCSTATMLTVSSSLVDPYSAVSAACAALYGPSHGGACEAVIRMLEEIQTLGGINAIPDFLEGVKKKERVLSGFGHRVYKTSDPRSFIIRKTALEVFKVTGSDPLLDIALALHDAALKDDYFVKRKLAPNVDFFSGLIYKAMGFPSDYFPVLFAVPRVVGWLAHWRQSMLQEGGVKIWRPRQLYVGSPKRDYVPVSEREGEADPKHTLSDVPHFGSSKRSMLATYRGHTGFSKL